MRRATPTPPTSPYNAITDQPHDHSTPRPTDLCDTPGTLRVTSLNAGMSLQALMALLGHRSPEMTIRYARLASPTLRTAYDQAIGKMRRLLPIVPARGPAPVPDRVQWLASEMLKTRVAHGYYSRDLVAEACSYANILDLPELHHRARVRARHH
jgi:hypothetical protein